MICLSYLFCILCIDGKIDEKANKYSLTGNEFSPSSKSLLDQSNRKSLPATEDLDVITVDGDSYSDDLTTEFDDESMNDADRFL